MPNRISWSSIELLHNAVLYFKILNQNTGAEIPRVAYRAKVKLHGTNCGVQIRGKGVFAQSREEMLTAKDDLKGFAKWVISESTYFNSLPKGYTVFGEWCGPGIEQGMAISGATGKVYAVFALQKGEGEDAEIIFHPAEIQKILGKTPSNMYVLPFEEGEPVIVDFADSVALEKVAEEVNLLVERVENEDPWVKRTFGISGLGEGVVFYPVETTTHLETYTKMMWKAKGKKHRNPKVPAAQINPEVVANISEFVDLTVTEARLVQGLQAVSGGEANMRFAAPFLAWVAKDVQKESVAELEASKMTWSQVEKAVQARAREWLRSKI